jgi:hypothetical protein
MIDHASDADRVAPTTGGGATVSVHIEGDFYHA